MRSSLGSFGNVYASASLATIALTTALFAQPTAPQRPHATTTVSSPQPALTLDGLLSRLAASPGFEARFREEKRIALLAAPLVTEGELRYSAPSRFVRQTTSPAPSVLLLEGRELRMGDHRGTERINLDSNPVVRQFVDGFMAVMRGDRTALEAAYTLAFRLTDPRDPEAWELSLTPRSTALQRVLTRLVLRGRATTLRAMTVHETSGDQSETVFSQVDPARRFTPAEISRYFRIDPR